MKEEFLTLQYKEINVIICIDLSMNYRATNLEKLDFRAICKLWNERNIFKIFILTLKTEIESSNLNKTTQRI